MSGCRGSRISSERPSWRADKDAQPDRLIPVGQYLAALNSGRTQPLEDVWPAEVVSYDPLAGTVRGHRQLRQFVKRSKSLLEDRHARTETIADTVVGNRVVVELLAHLAYEGQEVDWPLAVVAEPPDDRSVVFRTYLSERVIDGRQHFRAPILPVDDVPLADIVTTYQAALACGVVDSAVNSFATDGYIRDPLGGTHVQGIVDGTRPALGSLSWDPSV